MRISEVRFSVADAASTLARSVVEVTQPALYDRETGAPAPDGPLDVRLGRSKEEGECATCGLGLIDCMGHFGHVRLALPVFHAGFHRQVLAVLNLVCKQCARLLIDAQLHRKLVKVATDPNKRRAVARAVVEACRKSRDQPCTRCGFANGATKRVSKNSLALFCERAKGAPAAGENALLDTLSPVAVLGLFQRMPDVDCHLLNVGRPERLIVQHVPVPPACLRPMIGVEHLGGTHEDDLTVLLLSLARANARVRSAVEKGEALDSLMAHWETAQNAYANFVDSSYCRDDKKSKQHRGIVQRLEGKNGRFRLNLSGKRVNFTARSTISPDPNLQVNEVGLPEVAAKKLMLREVVRAENLAELRAAVINGPHCHPGAVAVWRNGGETAVSLYFGDNVAKAHRLAPGDVVERHVRNGDVVLFNRQPSLHRNSIMGHFVRVMPGKTMRLNECICTPYGADFDGDEMNVHVPQTIEAQAEARLLLGVTQNLTTPKTGEPIVAAIQDFITAAFMLTQKDRFFSKSETCQLLSCLVEQEGHVFDLPPPALWKPRQLWTGKQVFSALLQWGCGRKGAGVYLETKNKLYVESGEGCFDAADNFVVVRDSELMCGRIDKKLIGIGSKRNLVHQLLRERGGQAAVNWLSNVSRFCARYLGDRGFSIGIQDVSPSPSLVQTKSSLIDAGNARCAELIAQHEAAHVSSGELEQLLQLELSSLRERAGKACFEALQRDNAALVMANCGSKGSLLNISQMVALVGQQILAGARIPDGFSLRALPHFERQSRDAAARGFVEGSFFSGLSATEFFFHAMAGREGVIDTAVKTSETGYMQRRLIKSLEDLQTRADLSVRDAAGTMIQFQYGWDGLDPSRMEVDIEGPVDLELIATQLRSLGPAIDAEEAVTAAATRGKWSAPFTESVRAFSANRFSEATLRVFLERVERKYERCKIEPGTAVGALCSQSVGEPATQMTLKTFHSAGIGANITLGVPRLTELINASANPKTPLIIAPLEVGASEAKVESQIEPTLVRDICRMVERETPTSYELVLSLIPSALRERGLMHLTAEHVEAVLATTRGMKIKPKEMWCNGKGELIISMFQEGRRAIAKGSDKTRETLVQRMAFLAERVPEVLVSGHRSVRRVTVDEKRNCLVEGGELAQVMLVAGIVATETTSNNVLEVARVLGVEAARTMLVQELRFVMEQHHIDLNSRHLALLGDYMSWSGAVLGINRHGMAKTKQGILVMASFEKTAQHLFEAAIHNRSDPVAGVSEAAILGQPIPMGTGGDFALYEDEAPAQATLDKVPLLHRVRFNSEQRQ